jgi:type IV pilus assembly protein PilY1
MTTHCFRLSRRLAVALTSLGVALLTGGAALRSVPAWAATSVPSLAISQVPLTTVQAVHPQVLFALGNSQSMDGDLSGAILTGSGALSSALTSLNGSSSPASYSVPNGFTPPVNPGSNGTAPITVSSNGTLRDNSASRLNVAKAGINAIIDQYMPSTDFALMDYSATASAADNTWVYYMSPNGGFTFSKTAPTNGSRFVTNPCFNYTSGSTTVKSNCTAIDALYSKSNGGSISADPFMLVSASSDDPNINDVLYTGSSEASVFDTFNGPRPASPFPPNFSLGNYNNGSISVSYSQSAPNVGGFATNPTNAGYVPFSTQVIYAQRGFGYSSTASATKGHLVVDMTSAGNASNPPTQSSIVTAEAAFSASLAAETNQSGSAEIKALAVQSPLAGLLASAQTELAGDLGSGASSCLPTQYVVLITDGLPTQDLGNKLWPPLGSASASGYGVTASFNADGSLASTNDQALTDTIGKIKALNSAGVKTYVIGLGAGVDPSQNAAAANTLAAMAVAGGTGSYFPATSPQALTSDLSSILTQVLAGTASASAVAVNSHVLNANTQVYQATYTSSTPPYQDWTGDLAQFPIDPTTGQTSGTSTWDAQTKLDSQGSRSIATLNPATGKGVGFVWNQLSAAMQAQLQPADSLGSQRLSYLRGMTSLEQRNGGSFRNRSHLLGDIVDGAPVFVGAPAGPWGDPSYASFVSAQANRAPMVYAGANDGMLHGFNAATGSEAMAFVPAGVFGNLSNLSNPLYNNHHLFYVDGAPQAFDALLNENGATAWHTLLVGGEGAGGNSIYALDVTNPASYSSDTAVASDVLWEFTDADMGLSFSVPTVARSAAVSLTDPSSGVATQGFAVLFGNGYNSASGHPIFYAVDASSGALLRKIDLCAAVTSACNPALANGLSSISAANSNGVAGAAADMAYAGDLQGNLWAINLSSANPANWTVSLLFTARDPSGKPQPITTAPALSLNPNFPSSPGLMAFVGTGQLLTVGDLSTSQTQSVYGVWDNTLALGNYTAGKPVMPYARGNLAVQTVGLLSAAQSGLNQSVLTSSNNPVNLGYSNQASTDANGNPLSVPPQQGWYFDLTPLGSGSRSVTALQLENGGVVLTTYAPSTSPCAVGGTSFLLDVNFATGGPFSTPQIGLSGGISVGAGNAVNGQNPTGVAIGSVYSASPTALNSAFPGGSQNETGQSSGQIQHTTIGTSSFRQVGWWQLQ